MIADQWTTFRKAVMPPGVSPIQLQEMRRAFYAGAEAMMRCTVEASGDPKDESEQDLCRGERALQALQDELQEFATKVATGMA